MKATQLANAALLATTLVTSVSSQAADNNKTYRLSPTDTDSYHLVIQARNLKELFVSATSLVATKAKEGKFSIDWKSHNGYWDVVNIKDDKGANAGKCRIIDQTNMGFNNPDKPPIAKYSVLCWDGTNNEATVSAESNFTFEKN